MRTSSGSFANGVAKEARSDRLMPKQPPHPLLLQQRAKPPHRKRSAKLLDRSASRPAQACHPNKDRRRLRLPSSPRRQQRASRAWANDPASLPTPALFGLASIRAVDPQSRFSPFSTSRLIASERVASPRCSSSFASNSAGSRTLIEGSRPVAGRPLDFWCADIDAFIF